MNASRIGDTGVGTCCCHSDPTCISMTGILVAGAATVKSEGINTSRIGDTILGSCGHTGIMIGSSGSVKAEGLGISRIGDSFEGCFSGIIVGGASTVFVGD